MWCVGRCVSHLGLEICDDFGLCQLLLCRHRKLLHRDLIVMVGVANKGGGGDVRGWMEGWMDGDISKLLHRDLVMVGVANKRGGSKGVVEGVRGWSKGGRQQAP